MNSIIEANLRHIFHYENFQLGQREIIHDIIEGKDVLGILPTGSGKSLCYQLPATLLPGITVVVSPLISLMIDQVRQIKAYYFKEVAAIHSFHQKNDRYKILKDLAAYKLIFVSPELLQQQEVISYFKHVNVSLFCIDEAHCISQWGYDFRPDYLRLKAVITELGNPAVLALTGTASEKVRQEIITKLNRPQMISHVYSMERTNISFMVEKISGNEQDKRNQLLHYIQILKKPAVIYFSSRMTAEQMTKYLMDHTENNRIAFYHAGMEAEDRLKVQEQFINEQLDIICSTSAFGMGINKRNIRTVIHYHLPAQLESFMQEIGRAGRDGKESVSLLLYREGDKGLPLTIIENELPLKEEIEYCMNQLFMMYKTSGKLPQHKTQIEQQFQVSETKWRFLHYQFELHGVIKDDIIYYEYEKWQEILLKINEFCISRIQIKRNKLNEMVDWVHTAECLRYKLYKSFQNNLSNKIDKCCSNCGLNVTDETRKSSKGEDPIHWQEQLKSILLFEELEYEKSK